MRPPLPLEANADERQARYDEAMASIRSLLEGEEDWVAAMATVASELQHAFAHYQWSGFYRFVGGLLIIGPYQGGHGCLRITLDRGVCGAAARTRQTQLVDDVELFPGHIACSSSTRSEIVVPILGEDGDLLGVLDVDSDTPAAFTEIDRRALEDLCAWLGARYGRRIR